MNIARFFVKKPIAQIQGESQASQLKRSLGAFNLISLGIGCIIGAGIFVITGQAAADHAGPAIMLSFVLAGLACAFAALCYAELASVLPVSGSAYTYAYATLGEIFAWAMGWLLVLEYGLAASTVAVGWSGYFVSFVGDLGWHIPEHFSKPMFDFVASATDPAVRTLQYTGNFNLPASLAVLFITCLLVLGIKESVTINNVIVMVKMAVILLFIAVGALHVNPENWHPFVPDNTGPGQYGFEGVLKAAGMIFFAYIGFEAVSTAAQEAKNPQRDMPIGILGSLFVCTILYMAVAGVLTGIVHYSQLSVPDPMAVAVDSIGVAWLSFFIKVGAITGLTSVMLVLIYGQTRIFYTMSRDGLIPSAFSTVHSRFQTPYINTLFVGFCVALAAGMTPIKVLGNLVSMGTLFAFCIVCFSVLYLRLKEPNLTRPFRVPFSPVVPLLGIAFCGYLMYGLGWQVFVTFKYWFLAGIVLYLCYGQFRSKVAQASGKS